MKEKLSHPFPPLFSEDSKILILGSFPSVKSRENNFYYGHPQNRFWKVMSAVLNEKIPENTEEKKLMLLNHKIALWDCIASCEIQGSSDASIDKVIPNDIGIILNTANISAIFCNGKKAYEMFQRHVQATIHCEVVCLPSTSPANATWKLSKLIDCYAEHILPYLQN
jgi:hypoxanthine-DNA glycosylase